MPVFGSKEACAGWASNLIHDMANGDTAMITAFGPGQNTLVITRAGEQKKGSVVAIDVYDCNDLGDAVPVYKFRNVSLAGYDLYDLLVTIQKKTEIPSRFIWNGKTIG